MDRLKLWERTLVIFIADHGYHHNERGWWNKNTLFDRSCRVPFIAVAPGVKGGQVCRSLIELVDIYATVADYCGVKPVHTLAGQSLRPLLENPAAKGRDAAFTIVVRGGTNYGQAIRTERWRFIQWSDGTSELYDHENDPEELHDVSARPEHAGLIKELQARLKSAVPYKPARGEFEETSTNEAKKKKKR
jgi:arylsulfatase A-like enzyme